MIWLIRFILIFSTGSVLVTSYGQSWSLWVHKNALGQWVQGQCAPPRFYCGFYCCSSREYCSRTRKCIPKPIIKRRRYPLPPFTALKPLPRHPTVEARQRGTPAHLTSPRPAHYHQQHAHYPDSFVHHESSSSLDTACGRFESPCGNNCCKISEVCLDKVVGQCITANTEQYVAVVCKPPRHRCGLNCCGSAENCAQDRCLLPCHSDKGPQCGHSQACIGGVCEALMPVPQNPGCYPPSHFCAGACCRKTDDCLQGRCLQPCAVHGPHCADGLTCVEGHCEHLMPVPENPICKPPFHLCGRSCCEHGDQCNHGRCAKACSPHGPYCAPGLECMHGYCEILMPFPYNPEKQCRLQHNKCGHTCCKQNEACFRGRCVSRNPYCKSPKYACGITCCWGAQECAKGICIGPRRHNHPDRFCYESTKQCGHDEICERGVCLKTYKIDVKLVLKK